MTQQAEKVLILDFGSQTTQLIARRVRELKVYCEIHPFNWPLNEIKKFAPAGIILSGGPASVYWSDAPKVAPELFQLDVPVLGICYGMQLMAHLLGGRVARPEKREYGRANLTLRGFHKQDEASFDDFSDILGPDSVPLFADLAANESHIVWMSHGDRIEELPPTFDAIAASDNAPLAAMADLERNFYGVQFHPEVAHTPEGKRILANFLFQVCNLAGLWSMESFVQTTVRELKEKIGTDKVICAMSGGVDSSVVAMLLHKAVGEQCVSVFVDNGLLRHQEAEQVVSVFQDRFGLNLIHLEATDQFLARLAGVEDPERKRTIIGNLFIEVFEAEADRIGQVRYLAQGTLYPDVIESVSFKGPSATIKTHHNVGGLPERMNLELIEPLRELFKDEVRAVGRELGLPDEVVLRQPFPGPGLAIRILGDVTPARLSILRQADKIVHEEILVAGLYERVWQSFAVLLPVKTVGVMGDERTYENVIALRCVDSLDAMTADWTRLSDEVLAAISNRIINEVAGVNRVVFDISSKPPATIEWE